MGNTEAAVPFDNILTTLWGLVAFGGFVTGLLTPRADIYYDRYVQTVKEGERLAARRWWLAATVIPAGVLFLVVAAFIGAAAADSWRIRPPGTTNFWLLTLTVVAQGGFLVAVFLLLHYPRRIEDIAPESWQPGMHSQTGRSTSVRFLNESMTDLELYWVDYAGKLAHYGRFVAGDEIHMDTYVGHPFLVRTDGGIPVAVFQPLPRPAVARITNPMVRDAAQKSTPARSEPA